MMRHSLAAIALLILAGCGTLAIDDPAERVEARIIAACEQSGLFRRAIVAGAWIAVPAAALPVSVIAAGVDRVCADPARFARDVSTVAWVVRNLRDRQS